MNFCLLFVLIFHVSIQREIAASHCAAMVIFVRNQKRRQRGCTIRSIEALGAYEVLGSDLFKATKQEVNGHDSPLSAEYAAARKSSRLRTEGSSPLRVGKTAWMMPACGDVLLAPPDQLLHLLFIGHDPVLGGSTRRPRLRFRTLPECEWLLLLRIMEEKWQITRRRRAATVSSFPNRSTRSPI